MKKLECTVCGGKLIISADGKTSECENCGAGYTIEAMQQMLTEENPGVVKVTGAVKVSGISDADKLAQNGETFLKLGDWEKSNELYKRIVKEYPENYRGWWGLVQTETRMLTWNPLTPEVKDFYAKALKTASPENALAIKQVYDEAVNKFKAKLGKMRTGAIVTEKARDAIIYLGDYDRRDSYRNDIFNICYFTNQGKLIKEFAYKLQDGSIISDKFDKSRKYDIDSMNISEDGKLLYDNTWIFYISDDYRRIIVSKQVYVGGLYRIEYSEYVTDFKNHEIRFYYIDGGPCYIATAVYGDYDAPQVLTLRRFRDEVLLKSKAGQAFVAFYYKHSPRYAEKLKDHKLINQFVRFVLDVIVKVLEKTRKT